MTTHDILALLWRSTLALSAGVVCVLILRKLVLRIFGAQATYLLWTLAPAMLLAACLPTTSLPISTLPAISVSTRAMVVQFVAPVAHWDLSVQNFLIASWLLGAMGSVVLLIRQQNRFTRSLGMLRRESDVWRSESVSTGPALVGALHPRVVLPADFETRYGARERALIIAHECLHLNRGDAQINALVALLRCLNWFNPLIHFAASRFRFDQELACDAAVIARFPEARRSYADAMLRTQLASESRQELRLPVGCYWQTDHPLKERIMALKRPIPARTRRMLATACVLLLVVTGTLASWAAQPDVDQTGQTQPKTAIQPEEARNIARSDNVGPSENITFRKMRPPKYPQEALKAHLSANVILKVQIDEYGNPLSAVVEEMTITRRSNLAQPGAETVVQPGIDISEAFAKASTDAAMSWQYNPGLADRKPFGGYVLVPIDYAVIDDNCDKDKGCGNKASGS